jgi:hypothetical protein
VFTLRRVIRADQVGTDLGVGLAELYAEVEAAPDTSSTIHTLAGRGPVAATLVPHDPAH